MTFLLGVTKFLALNELTKIAYANIIFHGRIVTMNIYLVQVKFLLYFTVCLLVNEAHS